MAVLDQNNLFADAPAEQIRLDMINADVTLFQQFFGQEESDRLLDSLTRTIHWQQEQIRFSGKAVDVPRLTAWYGDSGKSYSYSGISMQPNPWSDELLRLKRRVEEAAGVQFSSVLLNYYRTNRDSVAWHSDNEKELGENPVIASVSFGAEREFQMRSRNRHENQSVRIPLMHGSLLIMKGTTQKYWEHQIPKTSQPLAPRINLTFRAIK